MLLIAVLLAVGAMAAQTPEETAVRALVARYVEARERADGAAVEALFTASADQLVSTGEWRKGRPEVVKGTVASSHANAGRRTITVESVRLLAPGVAIADGRYEIASAESRQMWTSIVCVEQGGSWRIAAIRNMLPAK